MDFSKEKKKKRVLVASVNILPCLGYFSKEKKGVRRRYGANEFCDRSIDGSSDLKKTKKQRRSVSQSLQVQVEVGFGCFDPPAF